MHLISYDTIKRSYVRVHHKCSFGNDSNVDDSESVGDGTHTLINEIFCSTEPTASFVRRADRAENPASPAEYEDGKMSKNKCNRPSNDSSSSESELEFVPDNKFCGCDMSNDDTVWNEVVGNDEESDSSDSDYLNDFRSFGNRLHSDSSDLDFNEEMDII